MELQQLFQNYSPIRIASNTNIVNRLQNKNPIILRYNDMAFNNMRNKLAQIFNIQNKTQINRNLFKVFIQNMTIWGLIIYFLHDKFNTLYYYDKNTKNKKPRLYRIIIICIILSSISVTLYIYE